jgi:hypothetical protein
VVKRVGVFVVAFSCELRQVANQRIPVAGDEPRQLLGELGIQRPVARQIALIEQTDVELDVVVVDFGALARRPHRMTDSHAGVPQGLEKCLDSLPARQRQPLGFE